MIECAMGFCDQPAARQVRAFDNAESAWWCEDHAELAEANAAATAERESHEPAE